MSEPETMEHIGRAIEEIAAEATGHIERHRATCERFGERDCDACHWWRCACGEEATNTPTLTGHNRRPAMCGVCLDRWEREQQFTGALATIPAKWQGIRLSSPELPAYVTGYATHEDTARRFLDVPGPVILRGPTGAGKTTLACAMGRTLIDRAAEATSTLHDRDRARKLLFTSEMDLAKSAKEAKSWQGDSPLVARAIRSSVLILDDLGQKPEDRTTIIAEIIEERYRNRLPTWVTTFLTSDEMIALYGAGTHRRLCEARQWILLGAQR